MPSVVGKSDRKANLHLVEPSLLERNPVLSFGVRLLVHAVGHARMRRPKADEVPSVSQGWFVGCDEPVPGPQCGTEFCEDASKGLQVVQDRSAYNGVVRSVGLQGLREPWGDSELATRHSTQLVGGRGAANGGGIDLTQRHAVAVKSQCRGEHTAPPAEIQHPPAARHVQLA